jgi:hypothetical protein
MVRIRSSLGGASLTAPEGPMVETSFADQVATFNIVLDSIETRVASGEVPLDAVADFKSSVDELRLRLWGVLGAGSATDYRAFQERFRLRRAKEICRGLDDDLKAGALNRIHEELRPLGQAAASLAGRIEAMAGLA